MLVSHICCCNAEWLSTSSVFTVVSSVPSVYALNRKHRVVLLASFRQHVSHYVGPSMASVLRLLVINTHGLQLMGGIQRYVPALPYCVHHSA